MNNVLLDLEMAASRRHELEAEAAHERLALEAIRQRRETGDATLVDRLLGALMGRRRQSAPSDPRLN